MEELKPCPFCGGKASFVTDATRNNPVTIVFSLGCSKCRIYAPKDRELFEIVFKLGEDGNIKITQDCRNSAIEKWNRRAES